MSWVSKPRPNINFADQFRPRNGAICESDFGDQALPLITMIVRANAGCERRSLTIRYVARERIDEPASAGACPTLSSIARDNDASDSMALLTCWTCDLDGATNMPNDVSAIIQPVQAAR